MFISSHDGTELKTTTRGNNSSIFYVKVFISKADYLGSPVLLTRPISLRCARDWRFSLSQQEMDSYAQAMPERLSCWWTMLIENSRCRHVS